jgi:alpha-1,2-mannosyltransferase
MLLAYVRRLREQREGRLKGGRRIWSAVLAVLAFGVLALASWMYVRSGFGALAGIASDSMVVHMDFDVFWRSARALLEGGDVYSENGGPSISTNPPFWTVLVVPLALLEPITAYRVFVLLAVLAGVSYVAWTAEELRLQPAWAVFGASLLVFSNPFLGTLALGQVYTLLALGLVTAWVADRRGKPLVSGATLGLVLAVKPQFAPVLLWPLLRRRWRMLAAALASGAAATLIGLVVAGQDAFVNWLAYVSSRQPDGYWDNHTLPGATARLFRENEFVEPVAMLPWVEPLAYVLGIAIIGLTALRVRKSPEMGLWALVAASLLASPISWHNYLVLLGPGVLLLMARGRMALAFLLLALQFIPPQWSEPWRGESTGVAPLVLTLYFCILVAHWIAFLTYGERAARDPAKIGANRSVSEE